MSVLIVVLVGFAMMLVELRRPGRDWPAVRGWWLRAFFFSGIQAGAVFFAGVTWDGWFHAHRLWSAAALGDVGGSLVGYVVLTFVYYWWHRSRHEVPWLWQWFHQLHHSPQRIEVITSFYKHPFEIAANALLSSTVMYLLVGLTPAAAAGATLLTGLAELFYHWNVNSPHWLGYLIQRPESHCVHHEEGAHTHNYGDLPLWDILFGTFHNPRSFEGRCGFGDGEHRLGEMLKGEDVNNPHGDEAGSTHQLGWRFGFLAAVGFVAMLGHVSNQPVVQVLALATASSPAPKVFTSLDGWETFSARFAIEVDGADAIEVTPQLYGRVRGPYNRRNVFGGVLAYGPVLSKNPLTSEMYREVAQRAACAEHGAPVLTELGVPTGRRVVLRYTTRDGEILRSEPIECGRPS